MGHLTPKCEGSGHVTYFTPKCEGSGHVIYLTPKCEGSGHVVTQLDREIGVFDHLIGVHVVQLATGFLVKECGFTAVRTTVACW